MKFTRMRSKLGKRRFTIIEDFTWCQRMYLQLFRGYTYACGAQGHIATIQKFDNMKIRYVDKHEILFKPGKILLNPLREDL